MRYAFGTVACCNRSFNWVMFGHLAIIRVFETYPGVLDELRENVMCFVWSFHGDASINIYSNYFAAHWFVFVIPIMHYLLTSECTFIVSV